MTKRTWTQEKKNPKHSNVWEWDETPEVRAALAKLHEDIRENNAKDN